MWLIQKDSLLRVADDTPIPPGTKKIRVPDDFEANPSHYRIADGRIVRRSAAELKARASARLTLTQDDIRRIKEAIEKGII